MGTFSRSGVCPEVLGGYNLLMLIQTDLAEEKRLKEILNQRTDAEALRIKRYLAMPDLSRTPGSPLYEITERVKAAPAFQGFDTIEIPEIVPTDILFDLFDFPADHPARSKSDTYYIDERNVLRTHDTVFWYYYLNHPEVKARIAQGEAMGALCHGKVYRKDEIDSRHMNIFHQFGGWYIAPKGQVKVEDLKEALGEIVKTVFGPEQVFRINVDNFPYTDPSFEVEVNVKGTAAEGPAKGEWLEILGSGMPKESVFKKMGVEGYEGWAFGFGIERLAIISMSLPDIRLLWSTDPRVQSQLKLGQEYKEVSKFPAVVRDISFVVPKSFVPNDYFDLIREVGGEIVEDVKLTDKYENDDKFGKDKMSYTYRVTYRHLERTLTNEEVNALHAKLEDRTEQEFSASVRRV
jgi:phenylalanyl-tRNA synthetase alpha chain